MKPDIHPEYRPVVFYDTAAGTGFVTRSTIASSQTIEWEDGKTYPLVRVDISSASHPLWTGARRIVDTAGQVEKFHRRYGTASVRRDRAGHQGAIQGESKKADRFSRPDTA